ncbi:cobyrinate a,c-diamide synthase [Clostridium guangxiense]|uniref:cobyrinate a,c-diamide synthase n=1 Tax=Clostridium guangxiense TaxID=1662055 RepID=UPI001E35D303|nr:cobyrinate a,c-diamide synthase [Clostridium guangxiense]MCD2348509.1 cobyrinate a,c-diamide synthase [Clostridium guangxiense]
MKGIMITAPGSGSGKTMITLGITRRLLNMGVDVCGFKIGPDYIDTAYLKLASKKDAGNLDIHLQGRVGMKTSLSMAEGEAAVIEGAMGYFDGIYNTFDNSSYDMTKEIKVNAVLVYTPKGEMFSAVPKIKGMAEFENSTIKAVILNKTPEKIYKMLKPQIEKYTDLKVLGYIPKIDDVEIKSRHLGLVQSIEVEDLEEKISIMEGIVEKNIDIELLLKLMKKIEIEKKIDCVYKSDIKVAVALDKAFSFYYNENLKLLESYCKVEYFSPLSDRKLPDCDLLYLGGGYPEIFRKELSLNKAMLGDVKSYAQRGGCIYAECGGFMYLMGYIEESKLVGIFKGKSSLTNSLQRFGYINVELKESCMLGEKGDTLTAHEFHKSVTEINEKAVFNIKKTMGSEDWECGYRYKNVLAGYPHISFLGNMKAFNNMLKFVENAKREGELCI